MITRPCRERHIRQARVKTSAGSHTAAVCDKQVGDFMHLVKSIQHAGLRILSHTGDAKAFAKSIEIYAPWTRLGRCGF